MKKEKVLELDGLRGIAFIAVVMQHLLGAYCNNQVITTPEIYINSVLFNAAKFAVPMFVFISGFALFYNYYGRLKYGSFIKKRASEILTPYLIWSFIYNFYYNNYSLSFLSTEKLGILLKKLLLGSSSYHLWYVFMIFQFYLLLPIIFYIAGKVRSYASGSKGLIFSLAVFSASYAMLMYFSSDVVSRIYHRVQSPELRFFLFDLRANMSIYYIFYFILGGIAARFLTTWRELLKRHFIMICALFTICFVWIEALQLKHGVSKGILNFSFASSLKPSMFIFSFLSIIFLYGLSVKLKKHLKKDKLCIFLSKHSYQAYLAHALVLNTVVICLRNYIHNRYLLYSLSFILCLALSLLLAAAINYASAVFKSFKNRINASPSL